MLTLIRSKKTSGINNSPGSILNDMKHMMKGNIKAIVFPLLKKYSGVRCN